MRKTRSEVSSRSFYAAILVVLVIAGAWRIFAPSNRKRVASLYSTNANALMAHDKFEDAISAFKKAAAADPANRTTETELLKATIFRIATKYDQLDRVIDLKELEDAEEKCRRWIEAEPNNAELTALLGIIYAHRDQPALAVETYKRAFTLKPNYPNVLNYWGYTAYQWSFPDDWKTVAFEKFNEAAKLGPKYAWPRINLALLYLLDQKFDSADKLLSEIEEKNNDTLYFLWGTCLLRWGQQLKGTDKLEAFKKFSQALDKFQTAEAINTKVADLHLNKGVALTELGSLEGAIDEYKKATQLEPNLVVAHDNLARLYAQNGQYDEEISELKDAVQTVTAAAEQFKLRRAKTSDAHAQKMLEQWMRAREKEKADYEDGIAQLTRMRAQRPKLKSA